MDRKIEHKCINGRLHATGIHDALDRQSGEQSESKNTTEIFHTVIVPSFVEESEEI